MPYALGIDLGSGHLAAAICRNDRERWSEPEVLALDGLAVTEAVLHLTDEGTVEVGDRALQHVTARPDRVTRGFVDRVGDEIPITLGGQPYPAEVLIAAVVGWIADYAEASEGMPASQLVVTHPAGWGAYRRATLLGALREAGLGELTLLPRPVAAAESYAAAERVEVGQEIAVHSLGAGRFESAVLRRGSFGFELRAHADAAERAGGDLFDDLLAARVLADLGHEVEPVALAKLRVACRTAKERLSTELAVTVPAPAKSPRGTVMVNRTDLEELIRPAVEATVASLQRTIQAAGTSTGSLQAVVLVGGCGRIPLVSELVSAGVRVRVAAAADPELSVARGAALAAARVAKPTVKAPALAHKAEPVAHTDLMRFDDLPEEDVADVGPPPPRPPVEITPLEPPKRRLLRLGTRDRDDDDPLADLRDEDARPARRERPRSTMSGEDLFTPLDDSAPDLLTHTNERPQRPSNRPLRTDDHVAEPTHDRGDPEPTRRRAAARADEPEFPRETHEGGPYDRRQDSTIAPRYDAQQQTRHEWPPERRNDIPAESHHDTAVEDRHGVRAKSHHNIGPEHRIHTENQHDIGSESHHSTRTESHHDTAPERRHIHTENQHDTTPQDRHGVHAESHHAIAPEGHHSPRQESWHDIALEDRQQSRYDIAPEDRHGVRAEGRHDIGSEDAHSIRAESRHDIAPERRHGTRQESRGNIHRDTPREPRHEIQQEPLHEARQAARHESHRDRRHDSHLEARQETGRGSHHDSRHDDRHQVPQEARRGNHHDGRLDNPHDGNHENPYDTRRGNHHDNRRHSDHENWPEAQPETRHRNHHDDRHDNGHEAPQETHLRSHHEVPLENRRGNHHDRRHESQREGHRGSHQEDRPENGSRGSEVPQEGHHRSRYEARSEGGRRHRTDDRAFNESLTRARHATRTADGDYEDLR